MAIGSLLFAIRVSGEVEVEANGHRDKENGRSKEDKAGSVAFFV